jgi:hypothetical protein
MKKEDERKRQDVSDRVTTAEEGRYMNNEGGLDDRGLEPRRDVIDGQGQAAADRISTAREGRFMSDNVDDRGLEPRRDVIAAERNVDVRGRELRRDVIDGQGQAAADRISTAREERFMNDNETLDDRGLEPRRDERPTGGETDAQAEMRETEPGMQGATENT